MNKLKNTVKSRQLIFRSDLEIVATFKGGKVFRGTMGQLHEWVRAENVDAPLSCIIGGLRHGIYPALQAGTPSMVAALSVLAGEKIEMLDGITFATRSQLKDMVRRLAAAGIQVQPHEMMWMVTEHAFANCVQPKLPIPTDDEIPF